MQVEERRPANSHAWTWNEGLRIVYHPRGCTTCVEYSHHVMEAEFTKDEEYLTAKGTVRDGEEHWRQKAIKYIDELEDAEADLCKLTNRVKELKEELDNKEYTEVQGGKRAHYESTMTPGVGSPAPAMTAGAHQRAQPTYLGALQAPALSHIHKDVTMDDGETSSFPALPPPGQPISMARSTLSGHWGANWMPATALRPMRGMRGGLSGRVLGRSSQLLIQNEVLNVLQHID